MSRETLSGTPPNLLDDDLCWAAVASRDKRWDGCFVYGVRSTGVYCRPSCSARRPRRDRVAFFRSPEAAERGGFRPCLRCDPSSVSAADPLVQRVQTACRAITDAVSSGERLGLAELSRRAGLSASYLQRIFRRLLGVTPGQYAGACRESLLKAAVRQGSTVTDALYRAGYSSPSRVYENSAERFGMTPGAYGRGGAGKRIRYSLADSPLGRLLVAGTETGVSFVALGDSDDALEAALRSDFPKAEICRDDTGIGEWLRAIVAHLGGWEPHLDLPLDLRATAFQLRVYEELRRIPYGSRRTYEEIANALGKPQGARAVGAACASNPVSILIPCHRAVRKDGSLAGYRWGLGRKRALLDREARSRRD